MVDRLVKLLIVGWVIGLCAIFRFWYKEEKRKHRQQTYWNRLRMIGELSHEYGPVELTTLEEVLKSLRNYPK